MRNDCARAMWSVWKVRQKWSVPGIVLFPGELDVHSFLLDKEEYVVLEAAARNVFVGRLWWVTSGMGVNERACAQMTSGITYVLKSSQLA